MKKLPKAHQIDLWDAADLLGRLWREGVRGAALVKEIRPLAEAWANRAGKPVPVDSVIYMNCRRYMLTPPIDRRTKQAKAQVAAGKGGGAS